MTAPTIRHVTAPAVPEPPPGLFSNCLLAGDTIHISGQHAGSPQGPVGGASVLEQTREALKRVLALIRAAGGDAAGVVKLTVYLRDMSRKAEVSAARREVFAEPMPCSTLIGVNELVAPDLLVEVDAIAVIGARRTPSDGATQ
ncbi:RidA family protein [Pseudolabrys taiwanensis]|uniref:RidA family protein n=1 Tax=Pseudolabrys taiwanensis TaxID=331696 RepID=UPI001AECD256|nr:RidA family protein [Pseudolabrys taiwanensis]